MGRKGAIPAVSFVVHLHKWEIGLFESESAVAGRPGTCWSLESVQQILRFQERPAVWKQFLAAFGSEESVAKIEIASALKRVREQEVASVRVDPDAKVVAARDKVARSEQAIAAMDFKGAEMDTVVSALKRAQKDAQEQPLDAQIRAEENRSLRRGACSRGRARSGWKS